MDLKALDKALLEIVKNRAELSKIDYNNPKYDELEEQLHDLEDDFQDEYGDFLESFRNDTIRSAGSAVRPELVDVLVNNSGAAVAWCVINHTSRL